MVGDHRFLRISIQVRGDVVAVGIDSSWVPGLNEIVVSTTARVEGR
ncbi:hypothetical protein HPS36_15725 (plasmid) [Halorubrum salinarum]|uniref:Uncharacterized protein n=1 Tax=Halorubrum salinarum TaxID=2739057 RepID=A0A7D4BFE5_9EURY|nr:hypothetical protein [Halorubrum salinarum]QKG94331.1 hypothetical protein HPS36_15725 [Halorubrum salinarum]